MKFNIHYEKVPYVIVMKYFILDPIEFCDTWLGHSLAMLVVLIQFENLS